MLSINLIINKINLLLYESGGAMHLTPKQMCHVRVDDNNQLDYGAHQIVALSAGELKIIRHTAYHIFLLVSHVAKII